MSILFKWSYYRTIQIEEEAIRGKEPRVQVIPPVLLKELPNPPPATSVI